MKYALWGIFIALLVLIVLLNRFLQRRTTGTYAALAQMGLNVDRRIGEFAMDSRRHKWMILRKNELHVHDFEYLQRVELWENDTVYHLQDKMLLSEDGAAFSPDTAVRGEPYTVERMEIHIYSSHPDYSEEVISLLKGKINSRSGFYFNTAHTAHNTMRLLLAILEYCNPTAEAEASTSEEEGEMEYVFDDKGKLVKQRKTPAEPALEEAETESPSDETPPEENTES